jgi:ribosomal protein S18 acetylase RimI-like enzyme
MLNRPSARHTLDTIPEIVGSLIISYLAMSNTVALLKTNRASQQLYQPLFHALRLLQMVIVSDYAAARILINKNPAIVFIKINIDDKTISPLRYALSDYDVRMLEMFLSATKHNNKQRDLILGQANEQKDYFVFEPVIDLYKNYNLEIGRIFSTYYDRRLDTPIQEKLEHLGNAWVEASNQLRKLLPWHMFKEFIRESDSWYSDTDFEINHSEDSNICQVYNYDYDPDNLDNTPRHISLLPDNIPFYKRGGDYSRVIAGRDLYRIGRVLLRCNRTGDDTHDIVKLGKFFDTRKNQQARLLEELKSNTQSSDSSIKFNN